MSQKYPGGFITKTPTAPTSSAAPGIWTLDQAMQNQKAGNWPSPPSPYIEDWFSTYLYTGNSSTQTITNGINLSANGGMVWGKSRTGATAHNLYDTVRGASLRLAPNLTNAQANTSPSFSSFNSNGFSLNGASDLNNSGDSIVSWTFAERQKFFDIVTYTGNGSTQNIAHNLGSVPGCIIVKQTNAVENWGVYHRSIGATGALRLNQTAGTSTLTAYWNDTAPTSTQFTVGSNSQGNASGGTYVAYLFAHDAGGFGLTGSDNVITCGSVTTDGSGVGNVTLGYEPQWILTKQTGTTGAWRINDSMRGLSVTSGADLRPNVSDAEASYGAASYVTPNATGFSINSLFGTSQPVIYIAIRRGPMKVPTAATTVFVPVTSSATGSVLTSNFPVDMGLIAGRGVYERGINDRLRGFANADSGTWPWLVTQTTAAETSQTPSLYNANNTSIQTGAYFGSASAVSYLFGRAPGFFDEVCWTGDGVSNRALAHNLGVVPELIITKRRSAAADWQTYNSFTTTDYARLVLNTTAANTTGITYGFGVNLYSQPTASNIYLTPFYPNSSGETFVAYLFATCPGVSKVGTYTGTGTTQTINCGFTAGSRFVMIKRTDSTGDWYVWDSARGIIPSNDPYLFLNTNAAETTGTDYVDTTNVGFDITSTAPAAINANGGTYIFLAIA